MHAGDGGHRAGRSEQMHAGRRQRAVLGDKSVDEGADLGDHRCIGFARDGAPAMALGKSHDADRERDPSLDLRQRRAVARRRRALEPHQLGRAAADVEQDHALRLRID